MNPPISAESPKAQRITSQICRILSAVILLLALSFKFIGAPGSVYVFTKLGIEPWGRYAIGTGELIAASLLLVSCKAWMGALLSLGLIAGAIMSHLFVLGIQVEGDGGLFFSLACTVFVCNLVTLYLHRRQVPIIGKFTKSQPA